ncbi:vWA domain-containing protein [Actinophytocola oryzae]|uniref:VWFA domain-containing protein n=1 Tax=Actinophytocola oryzae TaxID=502181 RepID=A0A4R7VRQ9_9PSEU|nr:VWA domain-containing protein [Actinophytocola oryzae]TDV52145.1 hypothetical protein CLV71_105276 [Actinophytocola oryzae]
MPDFVGLLVGFARALRSAGIVVGTGDADVFCAAAACLDPTDLVDLYWGGRCTLVSRHADLPVYDEVFRQYFLDFPAAPTVVTLRQVPAGVFGTFVVPSVEPGADEVEQESLGLAASAVHVSRQRSFSACTPEELAELRRILARLRLTPPRRRTRRLGPSSSGRVLDLRRMVRASLRTQGEPVSLRWRERRVRPRRLVLLLDVSGSMASYSRTLLQFAHTTGRSTRRVEVFCFGTRLTYLTRVLRSRSVDEALRLAGGTVADWEGGTRIGASVDAFVRGWARRGMSRGATVLICSDGLDRGEPSLLVSALDRLSRLSHRIVWVNPHGTGRSVAMMAADPYVDAVLPAADLPDFLRLLPVLA